MGRRRGTFSEPDNPDRKQKRRSDHVSDNKGANAHRRCPVPYGAPSIISLGMGATISPSPRTSTNCMAVSVQVGSREERRTQHVFQDNHDCFPRNQKLKRFLSVTRATRWYLQDKNLPRCQHPLCTTPAPPPNKIRPVILLFHLLSCSCGSCHFARGTGTALLPP